MSKGKGRASEASLPDNRATFVDAIHLMAVHEKTMTVRGVIFSSSDRDAVHVANSSTSYVVVPRCDVVSVTPIGEGISEVRLLSNTTVWQTVRIPAASLATNLVHKPRVDEENLPPPIGFRAFDDPDEGQPSDQARLKAGTTIEGAAKVFKQQCAGGGEYLNNCAHYLSNAFRNAGFKDFDVSHACIDARCNETQGRVRPCNFGSKFDYRPIRAKELRCWFAQKATTTADEVSRDSGFWAAYQQRPSDSQGHVAIIDTKNWLFYGTGWYSKAQGWTQEFYKW